MRRQCKRMSWFLVSGPEDWVRIGVFNGMENTQGEANLVCRKSRALCLRCMLNIYMEMLSKQLDA